MDATDSGTQQFEATPDLTRPDIAAVRAARWRLTVTSPPVRQGLLAFGIYLVFFITVYARAIAHHLNLPDLRQYWTDPNFYTWAMQWWPYAVSHGINPLYTNQIGAPSGFNLAWVTTTPSVSLLMWPVTAVFGVLVSYNLVLLLVPPVSAWAAFIAARRLTGRFWPSFMAGAVYGFSSYELVHDFQGQPNLTTIALFPLMVYLVLLWWDGTLKNTGFVIWMTFAMALEFYTFNEAFFDMTAVLAGGLVIGWAVAGRELRRTVARLAGLTAIAYAGAIVLAAPYLYYALKHYPKNLVRQTPNFSLHLVRLILPWSDKLFRLAPLVNYSNHLGRVSVDDYIGLPLILVLVGLAIFAWRSRITRLLVVGFMFVIALAAGPDLIIGNAQLFRLPWGGLWSLPIARSAEPSRLVVFASLVLALATALWLAMPAGTQPVRSKLLLAARWGLAVLAVAVALYAAPTAHQAVNPVAYGTTPPAGSKPVNQLPAFITDGMYRQYLRPGETVVIVTDRGNAGMLFQAAADFYFRIAGGFINASLTPENALPPQITYVSNPTRAGDRKFEAWVRSAKVGAFIVEQAWEDEAWMRNFATVFGMHGTSVGGVTIYPTAPWLARLAHPSR